MRGNVLVRCGEGLEETYAIKAQGAFILLHAVRCPHCQSEQIVKYGTTRRGTQCYLCQNTACTTGSFLLDYRNRGCLPEVKHPRRAQCTYEVHTASGP
jgi:transposase-like protein